MSVATSGTLQLGPDLPTPPPSPPHTRTFIAPCVPIGRRVVRCEPDSQGPSLTPLKRLESPSCPGAGEASGRQAEGGITKEPSKKVNCRYIIHLRSESDRKDFEKAKLLIKRLVPEILDVSETWTKQGRGRQERYLSEILSVFPTFAQYERYWPVRYYTQQTLGVIRSCIKKKAKKARQKRVCIHDYFKQSKAVDQAYPADIQRMMSDEGDVLAFLLSTDSSLGSQLDNFRHAGLNSRARLISLARWTKADKEAFLRGEVGLKAFECKIVSDALNGLLQNRR